MLRQIRTEAKRTTSDLARRPAGVPPGEDERTLGRTCPGTTAPTGKLLGKENLGEKRRCKATNKDGQPCRAEARGKTVAVKMQEAADRP